MPLVLQPGKVVGYDRTFSREAFDDLREATEELLAIRRVVPILVDDFSNHNKVQLCHRLPTFHHRVWPYSVQTGALAHRVVIDVCHYIVRRRDTLAAVMPCLDK